MTQCKGKSEKGKDVVERERWNVKWKDNLRFIGRHFASWCSPRTFHFSLFTFHLSRFTCLLLVGVGLASCGRSSPVANRHAPGDTIVCFGDSLTEGVGARRDETYPALLAQRVNLRVINAGISGHTTRDALARLQRDVLAHHPRIVIIAFGANDPFYKISPQETFDNLRLMVTAVQDEGAMVVLAGVRMGVFMDAYGAGYREVARDLQTAYVPDIMDGIIDNPALKSDSIHPNARGYAIIAGRIYEALEPLLLPADIRQ